MVCQAVSFQTTRHHRRLLDHRLNNQFPSRLCTSPQCTGNLHQQPGSGDRGVPFVATLLSFTTTFYPELPEGGCGAPSGNAATYLWAGVISHTRPHFPTPKSPGSRHAMASAKEPMSNSWSFAMLTFIENKQSLGMQLQPFASGSKDTAPIPSPLPYFVQLPCCSPS
jgi:hypothetical protein